MGADLDISVVEASIDVTLATLSVEVEASGPPILDIAILETAVNVDVAEMSLAIEVQEAVLEVSTQEAVIEVEAAGPRGPQGEPGVGAGITRIAAQALGGQRLVYASSASGCDYADNRVFAQRFALLGITQGAVVGGAEATILSYGPFTEPSWSWTPGPLYLGIDGLITQTPPVAPAAFLLVVGVAVDATHVLIDLHEPITLN
ncbi:hypothetical protein BH20PSE1_BH20PSE1_01020 [soil metagenome]